MSFIVFIVVGIVFVSLTAYFIIKCCLTPDESQTNYPSSPRRRPQTITPSPVASCSQNQEETSTANRRGPVAVVIHSSSNGHVEIDYLDLPPTYHHSITTPKTSFDNDNIHLPPTYDQALANTPSPSKASGGEISD